MNLKFVRKIIKDLYYIKQISHNAPRSVVKVHALIAARLRIKKHTNKI